MIIHPIHGVAEVPSELNNPFYYRPDALCRRAMDELQAWLGGDGPSAFFPQPPTAAFREEIGRGKMFGVLVVEMSEKESVAAAERSAGEPAIGYLAGYSGQIGGRADWDGFVPAVFDYLQDDGYFKQEEARIVRINEQIASLQHDFTMRRQVHEAAQASIDDPRPTATKGRQAGESEAEYIARRQYENAQLHRWKLRQRSRQDALTAMERDHQADVGPLKTLRRQRSDALQTWLFRQFRMRNGEGREQDLIDIFAPAALPPAGSGECCEPRLLQWAFTHGLRPVSMAMFWWGDSPRGEVRHHLQTYPACQGKCKPILQWMLRGLPVAANPLEQTTRHELTIVYEDSHICVVSKPAGMLSVPGKSGRESVQSVMRQRLPQAEGPLIVHRLDMDTSGLMVLAKHWAAYHNLQQQFLRHQVSKRYVALLTHDITGQEGDISLPLRPDLDDRPRQVVDDVHGRPAFTHWERLAPRLVALYPRTGRTHQLRVHCAHGDGLANPILGDPLYGQRADRLYLHAEQLRFVHPITGEQLTFCDKAAFVE